MKNEAVPLPDDSSSTLEIDKPANWSKLRKWSIVVTTTVITFTVSFSSSVYAADIAGIAAQFDISTQVSTLGIDFYVLGFGLGPLLWGPASELYGRTRPLFAGYLLFCLCQIPCALATDIEIILVARFFAALFGASTLAIVGGMYADFLGPVERGISTGVFSLGVFCGPVLGPVLGTRIVESLGWRWTAWLTLISSVLCGVICCICTPESFAPVLESRQARDWKLQPTIRQLQLRTFAKKYITKPVLLIVYEPILLTFTIYMSLVYGILYLTLTMYPYAFVIKRNLGPTISTLPFLFLLLGIVIGCGIIIIHSVHIGKRHISGRPLRPEDRLPPIILGSLLLPAGIFWFAFTSNKDYHWILQASSGVLTGCGIILAFMPSNLFLIEVYLTDANSALAINIFVRSTVAAAFPILSEVMFQRLDVMGVGYLLGSITLGLAAFPVLMILYGPQIRRWSRYAR